MARRGFFGESLEALKNTPRINRGVFFFTLTESRGLDRRLCGSATKVYPPCD